MAILTVVQQTGQTKTDLSYTDIKTPMKMHVSNKGFYAELNKDYSSDDVFFAWDNIIEIREKEL